MRKGEIIFYHKMEEDGRRWRTSTSPRPITGDIYMIDV
jgi:hypothetical protein